MKISLTSAREISVFSHERSGSVISIESCDTEGVTLTFKDESGNLAVVDINSREELQSFIDSIPDPKSKELSYELKSFSCEDVFFNIQRDNYGEPFEECVRFEFCLPDKDNPSHGGFLTFMLGYNHIVSFIENLSYRYIESKN